MAPPKRAAAYDSSSDEEIDMDKMIETKNVLNKIRKDREAARKKLKKDLEKTLADLRKRITQTVDAHTKQLDDINKAHVNRLQQAVAARDSIEQMIRDKLRELQLETKRLVAVVESGYEYRLEKASKSLVAPVSEQKGKAKVGSS